MKRTISQLCIIITLMMLAAGCSDSYPMLDSPLDNENDAIRTRAEVEESDVRLHFDSEEEVQKVLQEMEAQDSAEPTDHKGSGIATRSLNLPIDPGVTISGYRGLLSPMPGRNITYYEVYGYDTLVPDQKIAKLLNYKGEVEVAEYVYKITPLGTYKFLKADEKECLDYIEKHPSDMGTQTSGGTSIITSKLMLFHSFKTHNELYDLVSESGPNIIYPNGPIPEPNFNKFATFNANHHTFFGKIWQNLFGANKKHTVNFSNEKRLRGSFYFYNYAFVKSIGIQGWTDKKASAGWTKTPADELRVGWRHLIIKVLPNDEEVEVLKNLKEPYYQPPTQRLVNNRTAMVATLMFPSIPEELKRYMQTGGVTGLCEYLASRYNLKVDQLKFTEGCIVASPKVIYILFQDDMISKKDCKHINQVFAEEIVKIKIGYENNVGFSINDANLKNPLQLVRVLHALFEQLLKQRYTLIGGEAYVCGRFDYDWRGMKIVKQAPSSL
ncbi:MAG: hypothetical protein K2I37_07180 [Muribaculaceae bacterium]|nr:hypothetical protein [Muribaculaceae bacterium]